ncbi:hypothetical protein SAICODRAFT_8650 [Saitoella complicata NRRL Y-17804]|uniref:uncharacterized protein n=1 Tax=Saitoella complicata (strain BCRC 22490 / CBS 7301 / JCM 7358 / NBRC 10748 / NRRL Y-17804) TaxID=698492 RepID=UPI000866F8F4|nr:uncharacterized protein SAICODRAFT_8650 [Saitoella complicata NRRL Y-17804]ODQ51719.1 hypothetical protein SAICODRAFT_8650 [Saitoella complicata NRRL Y-17804]
MDGVLSYAFAYDHPSQHSHSHSQSTSTRYPSGSSSNSVLRDHSLGSASPDFFIPSLIVSSFMAAAPPSAPVTAPVRKIATPSVPLPKPRAQRPAEPRFPAMTKGPKWTAEDDALLHSLHADGVHWKDIATKYFPNKTPEACRCRVKYNKQRAIKRAFDPKKTEAMSALMSTQLTQPELPVPQLQATFIPISNSQSTPSSSSPNCREEAPGDTSVMDSYARNRKKIWSPIANEANVSWEDAERVVFGHGLVPTITDQGSPLDVPIREGRKRKAEDVLKTERGIRRGYRQKVKEVGPIYSSPDNEGRLARAIDVCFPTLRQLRMREVIFD